MDEWRRSGQIPAFGDWENANEMPITQYFECARSAGLIRYSSSSGECDHHNNINYSNQYGGGDCGGGGGGGGHQYHHDLYGAALHDHHNFHKHSRHLYTAPASNRKQIRETREKRVAHAKHYKEHIIKKQGKVFDVTEPTKKHHQQQNVSHNLKDSHNNRPRLPVTKAVDEDLYKIPPELIRSSKRKKMPGFFSCLVPACAS